MRGIARIRYKGGMLMLPAQTPYDREELFSRLDWCAGYYPSVRFELNGSHWTVSRASVSGETKACRGCDGRCTTLVFASGGRGVFCVRCMRLMAEHPGSRRPPASSQRRDRALLDRTTFVGA